MAGVSRGVSRDLSSTGSTQQGLKSSACSCGVSVGQSPHPGHWGQVVHSTASSSPSAEAEETAASLLSS